MTMTAFAAPLLSDLSLLILPTIKLFHYSLLYLRQSNQVWQPFRTEVEALQLLDSREDARGRRYQGSAECWASAAAAMPARLASTWPRADPRPTTGWMTAAARTRRAGRTARTRCRDGPGRRSGRRRGGSRCCKGSARTRGR